jgi:hypothetical protein
MQTMATMEQIAFANNTHRERFEEWVTEQLKLRPALAKREMAVLYVLSAMAYPFNKELLHPRGCFPMLDVAVERYQENILNERDAVLFILAINLHNGLDAFSDFGMEETATPYHFHCKLKSDIYLMAEAFKIYREGYSIDAIQ